MAANNAGGPQKALWIVALTALIGFGAVYVIGGRFDNAGSSKSDAVAQDFSAPDVATSGQSSFKFGKMAAFVAKKTPEPLADITFQDAAGKEVTLSSFKGKTILLNLWATWCVPCRTEMPALDALEKSWGSEQFEVIAVNVDTGDDAKPKKFLEETGITALAHYLAHL